MKVPVKMLVVRNKTTGKVINSIPITDEKSVALVVYPSDMIGTVWVLKEAIKDREKSERKTAYYQYLENDSFILEGPANQLPSIGNVQVQIETQQVEVN